VKPLTERQAARCEAACTPRCRCRCAGKFHGRRRSGEEPPDRRFFEELPADDPHAVPAKPAPSQLGLPLGAVFPSDKMAAPCAHCGNSNRLCKWCGGS
jgi:hypothetical protein